MSWLEWAMIGFIATMVVVEIIGGIWAESERSRERKQREQERRP